MGLLTIITVIIMSTMAVAIMMMTLQLTMKTHQTMDITIITTTSPIIVTMKCTMSMSTTIQKGESMVGTRAAEGTTTTRGLLPLDATAATAVQASRRTTTHTEVT